MASTGHECFEVTEEGKVAHVVLSRGEQLNTMTPAFWRELPEIVDELSDSGRVRAIVISSTGKHFSAGMDLAVFAEGNLAAGDVEEGRRNAHTRLSALKLQDSFTALERARVPVLVAAQGGVVGGAVDLATAADVRYCSADAFFVIQEINIGMTADVGTLQRLPKLIPDGLVRELAYTGRRMGADEALACGLVTRVWPTQEELVAGVLEVAREIASKSPLAVWGSKRMLTYARDHSVADALDYVATWNAGMFKAPDMVEAATAKGERREPVYEDLPPAFRGL